jgi:hypothetical protein
MPLRSLTVSSSPNLVLIRAADWFGGPRLGLAYRPHIELHHRLRCTPLMANHVVATLSKYARSPKPEYCVPVP